MEVQPQVSSSLLPSCFPQIQLLSSSENVMCSPMGVLGKAAAKIEVDIFNCKIWHMVGTILMDTLQGWLNKLQI